MCSKRKRCSPIFKLLFSIEKLTLLPLSTTLIKCNLFQLQKFFLMLLNCNLKAFWKISKWKGNDMAAVTIESNFTLQRIFKIEFTSKKRWKHDELIDQTYGECTACYWTKSIHIWEMKGIQWSLWCGKHLCRLIFDSFNEWVAFFSFTVLHQKKLKCIWWKLIFFGVEISLIKVFICSSNKKLKGGHRQDRSWFLPSNLI